MRTTKLAVAALAAVLVTTVSSTAQSPCQTVPKASASRYRFDLARALFASPEAEVAENADRAR